LTFVKVGVHAGLVLLTMQESWIHSAVFCLGALLCAFLAVFLKTYTFKKMATRFSLYFLLSALLAPSTLWLKVHFVI
jgi:hypothetical protein